MRTIALILLLAANCFAQETNVVAISDWSETVGTRYGDTLSARMVILQGHDAGDASELLSTMVYIEIKNCGLSSPEVYFDSDRGIKTELRDADDKPVQRPGHGFSGGCPGAYWITLPYDSQVRLRANCFGLRSPKEGGLAVAMPGMNYWFIKPGDTNDYFLTATLTVTPPADRMTTAATNMHVWSGTLVIPKMRISLKDLGTGSKSNNLRKK